MKLRHKFLFSVIGLLLVMLFGSFQVQSQDTPRKVVQFSGVIIDAESSSIMPGVNIFITNRKKGGSSNGYGFFTMPVAVGDSIVFSMIGYERQYLIIPEMEGDSFTVMIELKEDPLQLENVDIFPFLNERDFKEAILAMRAPKDYTENLYARSIDPEVYEAYVQRATMSPQMNYQMFMQQQQLMQQDRMQTRSFPFLNPFAWSEFIKSLRKKD